MCGCVRMCGLLNGPMFRRFTYRQVGFCGSLLVAISVFLTSVSSSFLTYVMSFSILYGIGAGINASANSLAVNTYFKEKRRIATGITWTATGLGPIVFPILIAYLIPEFGVQGTVMIFGGIALNAVACSLVFQPVKWHVKKDNKDLETSSPQDKQCDYCLMASKKNQSVFSSQYLYNSDHHSMTGYEIIDPGTPMMTSANDGWFSRKPSFSGSTMSLTSNRTTRLNSRIPSSQNLLISNKTSYVNLGALSKDSKSIKDGYDKGNTDDKVTVVDPPMQDTPQTRKKSFSKSEKREKLKEIFNAIKIDEAPTEDCPSYKAPQDLTKSNFNILQNKPFINDDTLFVNKMPDGVSLREGDKDEAGSRRGTFSQQISVTEKKQSIFDDLKYLNDNSGLSTKNQLTPFRKISTNSFNAEKEVLKDVSKRLEQYVSNSKSEHCMCGEEKKLLVKNDQPPNGVLAEEEKHENYTFFQKLCVFFDLDLLKDIRYINLMVGVTIANFAELNYSILTPFVLGEYGFSKQQIATCMSLLGAMDIFTRFFVPFIAGKIGWENKTFFLFGILGMGMGRLCVAHIRSYEAVIAASCWIGLNKGLRTVFMALVIPSYVPLARLPAATGLQLLFAGFFYFSVGPLIGVIRDATNYTVTLHFLNIFTYLTVFFWGLEKYFEVRKEKKKNANML
ncbi:uncharacterized protein LOC119068909 isoform X2 [Bradysia coprophila]|uniref:uncharacterized protein LOC119068909 isoform X2 n=1 Tax=Bradysia coprophila TaxID=38358 RepID=UPI00187D9A53|nr:uncharacterized protein LOC119068909 isoform X2 [Bradysia coprophila]